MTTIELATIAAALRPMCGSDPEAVQKALTLIKQAQNALDNRFGAPQWRPEPLQLITTLKEKRARTARR